MQRIAMTMKASAAALLLAATAAHAAPPKDAAGVQVVVLGTYHFGNPGSDIVNTKVDDVLQPHRQVELEALTAKLARFAPTKVMVERDGDKHEGQRLPAYDAWRAGGRRDVRNEVEQVGYRLAAAMKHEAVYGIDADGDFPFEAVQTWAKKNGAEAQLNAQLDELKQRSKADEQAQYTRTIMQTLAAFNDPARILHDHQFNTRLLRMGRGADQPGAELLGQWTLRNARSCGRMVQLAKPGDRILVLFGAGHSHLLRQCVREQPGWTLVEAVDYLR
ncbi:DUF5694 domain-containing protein [Roseateles asaccharophilus]|uniref:Opacity protein-like surface antigen n=1 Tax=Roseateles asaccharophilus TaxID=582607 RepID=A0ABU2AD58_9BURK|nr:DUF5694 domain-containing protein [Roseateles asaccharophilus]MDR7335132.1 opacity protein-like surface antigen [Roseateles asaccharophilus]